MTDIINSDGASASNGATSEYAGVTFSDIIAEEIDAYYFTRFAVAQDGGWASLRDNDTELVGSSGSDQINVNQFVTASYGGVASAHSNRVFVDLGDGDDGGVTHTAVAANGSSTWASLTYHSSTLLGGGGNDTLAATQNFLAIEGASVSVENAQRFVDGGSGFDTIRVGTTVEAGQGTIPGGTIDVFGNWLYAETGADGGTILGYSEYTAINGGVVRVSDSSIALVGGDTGYTRIQGDTVLTAGRADAPGGSLFWDFNNMFASTGNGGGSAHVRQFLHVGPDSLGTARWNTVFVLGGDSGDEVITGMFTSAAGGQAFTFGNHSLSDGGAGDDTLYHFLQGLAEDGGTVSVTDNEHTMLGGDGNDSLTLDWWGMANAGSVEFTRNLAILDGGAGDDSLDATFGQGTVGNQLYLYGGDGDDFIQSSDWGVDNLRLISGGAGNDTIIDIEGFSSALYDGNFSDYAFKNLGSGQIEIRDMRPDAPDGIDIVEGIDELQFADLTQLISDLYLPLEGTNGDDVLRGGFELDDLIYGFDGNDLLIGFGGDDVLHGGAGDDRLVGGLGSDQYHGGRGADTFVMRLEAGATDVVHDFSGATVLAPNSQGHLKRGPGEGDKIDLSAIDADITRAGDQAFTLVQHRFSGKAGEAYAAYDAGTGRTSLYLDVDGDAFADTTIQFMGQVPLTGADLIF